MDGTITWTDFSKVDMRLGTIDEVFHFPKARNPEYRIIVDFGKELGIKESSAQIAALYRKEALLGKQIIAVINIPKKQIANFMSECLILGAVEGKDVVLIQPESSVPNGLKIS